jgi:X-Pro dipeptidyl-peptidase C-terminal non-catalytic domain
VRYQPEDRARFEITFERGIDLAGPMEACLWVEAEAGEDMDLFVAIEKRDRNGELIGFPFSTAWDGGPVALGWLRASHRELDPGRSAPGHHGIGTRAGCRYGRDSRCARASRSGPPALASTPANGCAWSSPAPTSMLRCTGTPTCATTARTSSGPEADTTRTYSCP